MLREENKGYTYPWSFFSASTTHSNSTIWALSSSKEFSVSSLALISNGVRKAAVFGLEALEGVER